MLIEDTNIETFLMMINALVLAIYYLYVIKKSHTTQFVEMHLNQQVLFIAVR